MSTYGEMQSRIADELNRTGLTTQIQRAILSALQFYRGTSFRWNQARATTTLTADIEYYGLPTDFVDMGNAVLVDGNSREVMLERSHHWIDNEKVSTNYTGRPYVIAVQADQFRVFPTPSLSTYEVILTYVRELELPTESLSTSDWFTLGEELIRLHAKVDLLQNVIRGQESFAEATQLIQRESALLFQLKYEYKRSVASGRIQPD